MNDVERKNYEHELEAAKDQQTKHEPVSCEYTGYNIYIIYMILIII